MTWEELEHEVESLSQRINDIPDVVVGVVRGGLIPARLLSSFLKVKDMYCLTVKKAGNGRKVVTEISENIQGKNILLVEDVLETGRSLIVAKQYLEGKGARVKTACLYTMPISEISPDYSLAQIKEIPEFPWE
jgi:hypoxanthine phosphoribosyltransferase